MQKRNTMVRCVANPRDEKAVFRRRSIAQRTVDAARGTAAADVKVFVGGVEAAGRGGFLPPKQTGAQFMGKPY